MEEALGPGIGLHNSIWRWLTCVLDAALYPIFVAEYARCAHSPSHPPPPLPSSLFAILRARQPTSDRRTVASAAPEGSQPAAPPPLASRVWPLTEGQQTVLSLSLVGVIAIINLNGVEWMMRMEAALGAISLAPTGERGERHCISLRFRCRSAQCEGERHCLSSPFRCRSTKD